MQVPSSTLACDRDRWLRRPGQGVAARRPLYLMGLARRSRIVSVDAADYFAWCSQRIRFLAPAFIVLLVFAFVSGRRHRRSGLTE